MNGESRGDDRRMLSSSASTSCADRSVWIISLSSHDSSAMAWPNNELPTNTGRTKPRLRATAVMSVTALMSNFRSSLIVVPANHGWEPLRGVNRRLNPAKRGVAFAKSAEQRLHGYGTLKDVAGIRTCATRHAYMTLPFPNLTPEEAAAMIENHQTVGFSGFTAAGTTKAIPGAIATRARREHEAGRPFKIGVISGASTGCSLDGELARANAVLFRTPYQANPDLRRMINAGETRFFDMHLSALPGMVRMGSLGPLHWAVIEASDVTADGRITLTTSVGASPTFCSKADRVLVELNRFHPADLRGLHDIHEPANPPHRREIPIYSTLDRVGDPCVHVDPAKIAGIVETNLPDEPTILDPRSEVTDRIGGHVAEFLATETTSGRIPDAPLVIEVGGGNIANAMLAVMGRHPGIPQFEVYAEVMQDSAIRLLQEGRIRALSAVSLSVGADTLKSVYANLPELKKSIVLRPQEISNSPEVIQRLGLVAINTAVEVDIHGNANSSHVMGQSVLNGIGGSGDFTRNASISIFICPSTAARGAISSIVPMVSHTDHNEHSVQVVVTEHGTADLRGKDPRERARVIIENCADPDFHDDLRRYCSLSPGGHMPQSLRSAFKMHLQYMQTGSMRGVDWSQ